jgi:hypothetical protein
LIEDNYSGWLASNLFCSLSWAVALIKINKRSFNLFPIFYVAGSIISSVVIEVYKYGIGLDVPPWSIFSTASLFPLAIIMLLIGNRYFNFSIVAALISGSVRSVVLSFSITAVNLFSRKKYILLNTHNREVVKADTFILD